MNKQNLASPKETKVKEPKTTETKVKSETAKTKKVKEILRAPLASDLNRKGKKELALKTEISKISAPKTDFKSTLNREAPYSYSSNAGNGKGGLVRKMNYNTNTHTLSPYTPSRATGLSSITNWKKLLKHSSFKITRSNDYISHGGPGSGRWPKGSTGNVVDASMKAAQEVAFQSKNLIPESQVYTKKTHPNYDNLSDDYMNKVIKRKTLEQNYADAVGETKIKKSGGVIARETLQTIGTLAAIGLSIAGIAATISVTNKDKADIAKVAAKQAEKEKKNK